MHLLHSYNLVHDNDNDNDNDIGTNLLFVPLALFFDTLLCSTETIEFRDLTPDLSVNIYNTNLSYCSNQSVYRLYLMANWQDARLTYTAIVTIVHSGPLCTITARMYKLTTSVT